jgi:peroxiredoxin (alkyl hydroperoxide reductase subunit C)
MAVLVGRKAPKFSAKAVVNGVSVEADFSLEQYLGKKNVILFFYPKDFTFVCPTELHAFQEKLGEFQSRNTEVVAVSTDTEMSHWGWLQMDKSKGGIKGVTYPLVADTNKTISKNFDVLTGDYFISEDDQLQADAELVAYRGLFLIDKEGVVQHQVVNNLPLGRNVDEAIRMVDALTFVEENGEVCPANWAKGKEAMKPSHEGTADYLANN